eukprot:COSAG06_NODE_41777_length_387_cov_19.975694_1_plen_73_part_10
MELLSEPIDACGVCQCGVTLIARLLRLVCHEMQCVTKFKGEVTSIPFTDVSHHTIGIRLESRPSIVVPLHIPL